MANKEKPKAFDPVVYKNEYSKKNYKRVTFLLNKSKDKDVIAELETKKSMSEYLKMLVRSDIEKQGQKREKNQG